MDLLQGEIRKKKTFLLVKSKVLMDVFTCIHPVKAYCPSVFDEHEIPVLEGRKAATLLEAAF